MYVDDLLLRGKDQAENSRNVLQVSRRLAKTGMQANQEKIKVGLLHLFYLGYAIYLGSFGLKTYIES